jgi:hypothetical protein
MAEGNPIKYSDLVIDDGAIERLIKAIETLEKKFITSQKRFQKEIEKTRKSAESFTDVTEDQEAELEKLEKQLEKLIKANKELQDTDGALAEQKKKAIKLAKDEQKLRKKLVELTDEQTLANEELKIEIQQQRKEIKEQAKANKGLTGEYDVQSKRLRELRKEYKNLAVAGKENTEQAQKLLKEVTELDQKLKAVDKSVGQTQREVGNYKEQVKEALAETDLWGQSLDFAGEQSGLLGDIVAKLNIVVGILTKLFDKNTAEVNENTVSQEVNTKATQKATATQKGLAGALSLTNKGFIRLNKTIKRSIIGIILIAVAGLIAFFKETTAGAEALSGGISGIGQALTVIIGRIGKLGDGFLKIFSAIGSGITGLVNALTFNFDEAGKNFAEAFEKGSQGIDSFSNAFDGFGDAVSKAFKSGQEYARLLREIEIASSKASIEIAKLTAESERNEEIEADATKSFQERTQAIIKSIDAQRKATELAEEIAVKRYEAELIKLNGLEKGTESYRSQLIETNSAQVELIEAQSEATTKALSLQRTLNQLKQDELEKNLDILIDGFDNQKTINERIISNEKERFARREQLLKDTISLQKEILREETAEVQKATKKQIDIRDLIETQDSKILNQKIRSFGLSEILEGRLLEVVREARTQEQELNQAVIDLDLQRLSLKEQINAELKKLTAENIENEKERALELQRIEEQTAIDTIKKRMKLFAITDEEYQKSEKLLTEIKKKGVEDRETIEIKALNDQNKRLQKQREIELLDEGENQQKINDELTKLKIEQLENEIELDEKFGRDAIDKELELARLKNKVAIDSEKKKAEEIKAIQDTTAQAVFDSFQLRLNQQIDELDRLESKQIDIVDRQQQRAQEGLENNLAFEEQTLAELEQKKIQAQKKQIQLDKIRALYNAYSSASASGDQNALLTVLRDFSILQGLESAILSFGTGTGEHGDVSDFMDANKNGSKNGNSISNGVVRGESHAKRGKGIPVFVEGNEGIWKGSTMKKFGKNNFVALTNAIDSGMIGSNFMQPQVNAIQVSQSNGVDSRLLNEMKATRQAIENKSEQVVDVERVSKGVMDFIDERKSANKKIVNRHRVTKKRF